MGSQGSDSRSCSSGFIHNQPVKTTLADGLEKVPEIDGLANVANSTRTITIVFNLSPFYVGGVVNLVNPGDKRIQLVDNVRTLPSMVSWFRGDALNNWDASLMKIFFIRERATLQLRLEAFNVFNKTLFSNPNMNPSSASFGSISGDSNSPRYLQLGAKIVF